MNTIQLLQKLIQIPSFSGQEEKLAEFISKFCTKNNLPYIYQKGNIFIRLEGKCQNKALIFNAHMDTVSAGEKKLWKYPPYGRHSGVIKNNKIYGLGASDDKAAIAVLLNMARTIKQDYDLWFTFVGNEETDGSGTQNFLSWFKREKYLAKYKKIAVVIGEPTNLQKIEIGHRGNAFYQLSTLGKTGHSAKNYPVKDLAVDKMLKAIESLQKSFSLWKKKYHDDILNAPSLNITGINTEKNSINKIPVKCTATIDIRTTPKLHTLINQLIEVAVGPDIIIERVKASDAPAVLNSKSQFLKFCKKILPDLKTAISPGSTDLGQFINSDIEGIVLGPGEYYSAHTIDEYVEIAKLEKVKGMYIKIIENF